MGNGDEADFLATKLALRAMTFEYRRRSRLDNTLSQATLRESKQCNAGKKNVQQKTVQCQEKSENSGLFCDTCTILLMNYSDKCLINTWTEFGNILDALHNKYLSTHNALYAQTEDVYWHCCNEKLRLRKTWACPTCGEGFVRRRLIDRPVSETRPRRRRRLAGAATTARLVASEERFNRKTASE